MDEPLGSGGAAALSAYIKTDAFAFGEETRSVSQERRKREKGEKKRKQMGRRERREKKEKDIMKQDHLEE